MRPFTYLFLLALAATPAAAQDRCEAGTPPADDLGIRYRPLFQQNGVRFQAHLDNFVSPPEARLVVENHNRHPVEVSFVVGLEARADSAADPAEQTLGQRCLWLEAGQRVDALRGAAVPPQPALAIVAVRVRFLSIAKAGVYATPVPVRGLVTDRSGTEAATRTALSPSPAPVGQPPQPAAAALPGAATDVAPAQPPIEIASAEPARLDAAPEPAAPPPSAAGEQVTAPPAPAAAPLARNGSGDRGSVRLPQSWTAGWAAGVQLGFRLAGAALLAAAALGLALPVGGALYLLLVLVPAAALRFALRTLLARRAHA